jgi:hypothetical protein
MSDLIYPNLFLFLYDIRHGLGEDKEDLKKNQEIFASKFPEDLRECLFKKDTAFESEYLELLNNAKKPIDNPDKHIENFPDTDKPIEGYYYPVRLNDTYGLLVACSFAEGTTSYSTSYLAEFKAKIEKKINDQRATLGQTWLVISQLANPNGNSEEIAKNCCQALNFGFDWKRDLQGQGELLGGTLFELWRYELLMHELNQETIQQNNHLIIALYPNEAARQLAELDRSWLRLFNYRHKILQAYGQSRYIKQKLEKTFIKIDQLSTIDIKNTSLKQLRQTVIDAQKLLFDYTIDLNNLGYQCRNLEVSLFNYNRRLISIQERLSKIHAQDGEEVINKLLPNNISSWFHDAAVRAKLIGTYQSYLLTHLMSWQYPCDLKFLKNFSDDVEKKYLLQLQKDYESLSPGVQLLQDLMNSIKTITEINQAERDRNFQNTVAIFGIGLTTGSIVASICGQFPTNDLKKASENPVGSTLSAWNVPQSWLVPALSLVFSLSAAVIAGASTWLIICLWQEFLNRGESGKLKKVEKKAENDAS